MLEEYAVTVLFLVNESMKLEASDRLDDIMTSSVGNMEKENAEKVIRFYERQSKDASEIIDLDRDKDAGQKLTGIFGENDGR